MRVYFSTFYDGTHLLAPVASFTTNHTNNVAVAPYTVAFTDTSTNSPAYWLWNWGDGTTDNITEQNPVHTFTREGLPFAINLTVSNQYGRNTSATLFINVNSPPYNLAITPDIYSGTAFAPHTIVFTGSANASGGNLIYNWWIDGAETDSVNPISVSFNQSSAGSHTVEMEVVGTYGSQRTSISYILLGPPYQFVTKWGSLGTGNGQFNNSRDIAADTSGNVYVADTGNNRIQKFSADGTYLGQWGGYGSGNGQFNGTLSIATDSIGNVYVSDMGNNRTQKFTSSGSYLTQWPSSGNIAIDNSGIVYISTLRSDGQNIMKFTSDGVFLTKYGGLYWIYDLAVDSSGNMYGVNWDDNAVHKYSSDGTSMPGIYVPGPDDLAIDSLGNIFVSEGHAEQHEFPGDHRIQKFSANRSLLTEFGGYGTGDGQFNYPRGIAIAPSGDVYVADSGNNRIQKFTPTCAPVANFTANVTAGTVPLSVNFTDTSTGTEISSWNWDFNNDGTVDSTIQNPEYIYNIAGIYTINLTVTGVAGSDSEIKPNYINVTHNSVVNKTTHIGVFRSSSRQFIFNTSPVTRTTFGLSTDVPFTGDWNNDGITDIGVFRPSARQFIFNTSPITRITFGLPTDIPITGDWNGDGITDIGVFRPSSRQFIFNTSSVTRTTFGLSTDIPITGDWNGDHITDIGVFRPSARQFIFNTSPITRITFGLPTDIPITGDWNGDGISDIGVFRPSARQFIFNTSPITRTTFGLPTDIPITGKWV